MLNSKNSAHVCEKVTEVSHVVRLKYTQLITKWNMMNDSCKEVFISFSFYDPSNVWQNDFICANWTQTSVWEVFSIVLVLWHDRNINWYVTFECSEKKTIWSSNFQDFKRLVHILMEHSVSSEAHIHIKWYFRETFFHTQLNLNGIFYLMKLVVRCLSRYQIEGSKL